MTSAFQCSRSLTWYVASIGESEAQRHRLSRTGSTWTGSNRAVNIKVDFAAVHTKP